MTNRAANATGSALGAGVDDEVLAATALPNGDVVVGGLFTEGSITTRGC